MTEPKILVRMTLEEWRALMRCVTGELDAMGDADWDDGHNDDLHRAQKRLIDERERHAKHEWKRLMAQKGAR